VTESVRTISRSLARWPRGLSETDAATYLGVSVSLFREMVSDKRMPRAKRINKRLVWDIVKLDVAFDALSDDDVKPRNSWDAPPDVANEDNPQRRVGRDRS